MKTKSFFFVCALLGMSLVAVAQNTWDSNHSYNYDASTGTLSNVVLVLDHGGAATAGFDYGLRLLNQSGTTYYTIFNQSMGGLGGTAQGQTPVPLTVPTISLNDINALPAGNYILLGHATIVTNDVPFNTSLSYIVYPGNSGIERTENLTINALKLYPNPVKAFSNISFSLSEPAYVSMAIYNVNGKCVASPIQEQLQAGDHSVAFDMSRFKTGIYFYRFIANQQTMNGILVKE